MSTFITRSASDEVAVLGDGFAVLLLARSLDIVYVYSVDIVQK